MIKRNKEKILKILLISALFFVNTNRIKCWSAETNGSGGYDDGQNNTGFSLPAVPTIGGQCDYVSCNTSHSYNSKVEVKADIKLMDGTIINEDIFEAGLSTKFLAGTYIMLRVYEIQSHTSSASYSVNAKREMWKCLHYKYVPGETYCTGQMKNGTCTGSWETTIEEKYMGMTIEECECTTLYDTVTPVFDSYKDVTGEYIGRCSSYAIAQNVKLSPMYDANYRDSNDIDAKNNTGTSINIEGQQCNNGKSVEPEEGNKTSDGTYTNSNKLHSECSVTYDRKVPICMNVKTGMVRYLDGGGKCDESVEYEVTKDKDGYWKYFIPLNANSKDGFSFTLTSSGAKKNSKMCEEIIDKYPDTYQYKIIDSNMNSFIGRNISRQAAKNAVSRGCYFQTTAIIPVKQRFYNELENGKNFKGFNFYYRPIDINEPFPNGLNNTSLWYDWSKDVDKDPDISKSYNKTNYVALVGTNTSTIRNYTTDDLPYTTWSNMKLDGTSEFIDFLDRNHIGGRIEDYDKQYKLGCGPLNSGQSGNNIFYQPECGNS